MPNRVTVVAALLCLSLAASPSSADLLPEEIAIVVARGNKKSMELARYYCERRAVPVEHICEVDLPSSEVLDREQWRWAVRPEIQQWIKENDPAAKLRCLVTTWGVPLKIGPAKPDAVAKRYLEHATGERDRRLAQLEQIVDLLNRLGGESDAWASAVAGISQESSAESPKPKQVQERLEEALQAAQRRIANLPHADRKQPAARLQQLAAAAGGSRVLLQGMNQQLQASAALSEGNQQSHAKLKERFDLIRGRASAFSELKVHLDQRPPGYLRDSLSLTALQQTGGLIAAVEWLEEQIETARKNETGAALDSELSLIMWQDGYELLRWQPNYLRPEYENSQLRETFRTLMVSRLDAPTFELAVGLIDTAIAVEEQGGLRGKVYLDARGLAQLDGPRLPPGSYAAYDRSLLRAANKLRQLEDAEGQARFDVTLDTQPSLFQPGQCPEAALYCGWYSLAKYVDAFEWQPGAIAYHTASAEASTLKEIDSEVWCKSLLEDGVCVTFGPVYEPYLIAYPEPHLFLASIVQPATQVSDAFSRTNPFHSWTMVMIGDPLYTPFP